MRDCEYCGETMDREEAHTGDGFPIGEYFHMCANPSCAYLAEFGRCYEEYEDREEQQIEAGEEAFETSMDR